jgi:hypothetical protein
MRTLKSTLTALGLAALLVSPAWAQQRGGFRGFGGPGALLSNKSVQQEIKLDDKQVEEANKLAEDLRAKMREVGQSLQGVDRQERREKMQELMKPINDETNKALSTLLKPEQLKRYKQITLQQRGVQAFASPELQSELKLTDDQKEKIRAIQEENRTQAQEIRQNAQGDREAAREKSIALRKETLEKVLGVLNDDQKKAWKEQTGEPFEVKYERRGQQ